MATSTGTAHSYAPVFAVITREYKISPRHPRRQAVAFDDAQPPARDEPC